MQGERQIDTGLPSPNRLRLAHYGSEPVILNKVNHQASYCPLHSHDFVEVTYVLAGRGVHVADGQGEAVAAGDIAVINEHTSHRFVADRGYDLWLINCMISPHTLAWIESDDSHDLVRAFRRCYVVTGTYRHEEEKRLRGKAGHDVGSIFEQMWEEYSAKRSGYRSILAGYLTVLIHRIMRLYEGANQPWTDPLVSALTREPESTTVSHAAGRLGVHPRTLARRFVSERGEHPTSFLQRRRIEKAARLLVETDMPIRAVSSAVGYNDVGFFYRLFARHYATTPGNYRRNRRDRRDRRD